MMATYSPREMDSDTLRIINRDVQDPDAAPQVRELVDMYLDSLRHLEEGEVLKGRVLKVDENVKLKFNKSAVSTVLERKDDSGDSKE